MFAMFGSAMLVRVPRSRPAPPKGHCEYDEWPVVKLIMSKSTNVCGDFRIGNIHPLVTVFNSHAFNIVGGKVPLNSRAVAYLQFFFAAIACTFSFSPGSEDALQLRN